MLVTLPLLQTISPAGRKYTSNMNSIVVALNEYGEKVGLDQPHRLAHYLSQLAHESGDFRYDEEIASGVRYEGRKDLGNVKRGDGKKFKGRTEMQVTGRGNYRRFTAWVRKEMGIKDAPDFEAQPELINTDPYEGLASIWFWSTHGLNRLADQNDIEMITRTINGGLNGYEDRKAKYDRAALAILDEPLKGKPSAYIKAFQEKAGLEIKDGISGPRTRAALHKRLVMMTEKRERASDVQAAPVVSKEAVPVKVAQLEGSTWLSPETIGGTGATVVTAVGALDWRVGLAAVVVVAIVAAILIWRRTQAKQQQTDQVEAINARSSI